MIADRRRIFAANWKMNVTPSEARAFVEVFGAKWSPNGDGRAREVVLFPPAISVTTVVRALDGRTAISTGVQNIWTEDKGAFTGETSAPMARDAGARFVLVGHSERRHVFGETDAQTAQKVAAAARHGLTPVLCVGELLAEREGGATLDVVRRQLTAGLSSVDNTVVSEMVIAYEPVWAIGTGKNATPADAAEVHAAIRNAIADRLGDAAGEIPILYGGSVSTANVASLLAAGDVDGVLVGGASLDPIAWAAICDT